MPLVRPFAAIRPTRDKVHLVASRSYVSYTNKDLRDKLHGNPFTFLHVIHPDLGTRKIHKSALSDRFKLVRRKYEEFLDKGILSKEEKDSFYLYRQIKNGHPFTGLIAAISVEDYKAGKIKLHEHTIAKREATFTRYLEDTGINAEPVLLMSDASSDLENIFLTYLDTRPEYDFTSTKNVRHQLWVIDRKKDIEAIQDLYKRMPNFYIADGHHRCASSAALQNKWIGDKKISDQDHPANYFLGYILSEDSVRIYEFNRLVKDLNGMSASSLLKKLSEHFYIHEAAPLYKPSQKGEFSMYLEKQWYALTLKKHEGLLDADVLSDKVLGPLLGITDLRKDKRIAFIEGPQGPQAIQTAIDKRKYAVGFGLFPVDNEEIKSIADAGLSMPPKSTWIEPKLRSGLIIYELQ